MRSRALALAMWCVVGASGCTRSEEPLPAVALARVQSAPSRSAVPGVILTVTTHDVMLDGTRALRTSKTKVEPPPRPRGTFEWADVTGAEAGSELQTQLGLLREAMGEARPDEPQVRVRVAGDVRAQELLRALLTAQRAGYAVLEFEVATEAGIGQFRIRPYTFCACPAPEAMTWCAVPELRIDAGGVTLVPSADLTPPEGCHKAIRSMGQEEPGFTAAIDWRRRVIAGPEGGCPSAQATAGRLDVAALARRLRAIHEVAPGCQWASVEVDEAAPWSIVAPAMAALYAEYGEVRTFFHPLVEASRLPAYACADALPVAALAPRPAAPASLTVPRRGCSE